MENEISLDALENFYVGNYFITPILLGEYATGAGTLSAAFVSRPLLFWGTEYFTGIFTYPVEAGTLSIDIYDPGPVPSLK